MDVMASIILILLKIGGILITIVLLYQLYQYCLKKGKDGVSSPLSTKNTSTNPAEPRYAEIQQQKTDIIKELDQLRSDYSNLVNAISQLNTKYNQHELRIKNLQIDVMGLMKQDRPSTSDSDVSDKNVLVYKDEANNTPITSATIQESTSTEVLYAELPHNKNPLGFYASELSTDPSGKYFIVEVNTYDGTGIFSIIDNADVHDILVDNLTAFESACLIEKESFDARMVVVEAEGLLHRIDNVWVIDRRINIKIN